MTSPSTEEALISLIHGISNLIGKQTNLSSYKIKKTLFDTLSHFDIPVQSTNQSLINLKLVQEIEQNLSNIFPNSTIESFKIVKAGAMATSPSAISLNSSSSSSQIQEVLTQSSAESPYFEPHLPRLPSIKNLFEQEMFINPSVLSAMASSSFLQSFQAPNDSGLPSRFRTHFTVNGLLGKGGFGRVVRAKNHLDGLDYAIKLVTTKPFIFDEKTIKFLSGGGSSSPVTLPILKTRLDLLYSKSWDHTKKRIHRILREVKAVAKLFRDSLNSGRKSPVVPYFNCWIEWSHEKQLEELDSIFSKFQTDFSDPNLSSYIEETASFLTQEMESIQDSSVSNSHTSLDNPSSLAETLARLNQFSIPSTPSNLSPHLSKGNVNTFESSSSPSSRYTSSSSPFDSRESSTFESTSRDSPTISSSSPGDSDSSQKNLPNSQSSDHSVPFFDNTIDISEQNIDTVSLIPVNSHSNITNSSNSAYHETTLVIFGVSVRFSFQNHAQASEALKLLQTYTWLCKFRLTFFIQMAECKYGTLKQLLNQRYNDLVELAPECWETAFFQILDKKQCFEIFIQLLRSVCYVHSGNLVHRDITPGNIFLEKFQQHHYHVQLGDFGLALDTSSPIPSSATSSHDLNSSCKNTRAAGTPLYGSPEQLSSKSSTLITTKSDIFSLGIILFELFYTFETRSERSIILNQLKSSTPDKTVSLMPKALLCQFPNIVSLVVDMTHVNPLKRPNASEILKDPRVILLKERFCVDV